MTESTHREIFPRQVCSYTHWHIGAGFIKQCVGAFQVTTPKVLMEFGVLKYFKMFFSSEFVKNLNSINAIEKVHQNKMCFSTLSHGQAKQSSYQSLTF